MEVHQAWAVWHSVDYSIIWGFHVLYLMLQQQDGGGFDIGSARIYFFSTDQTKLEVGKARRSR